MLVQHHFVSIGIPVVNERWRNKNTSALFCTLFNITFLPDRSERRKLKKKGCRTLNKTVEIKQNQLKILVLGPFLKNCIIKLWYLSAQCEFLRSVGQFSWCHKYIKHRFSIQSLTPLLTGNQPGKNIGFIFNFANRNSKPAYQKLMKWGLTRIPRIL